MNGLAQNNYISVQSIINYFDLNSKIFGNRTDQLALYLQQPLDPISILGTSTLYLDDSQILLYNSFYYDDTYTLKPINSSIITNYYCEWNCPLVFGGLVCSTDCTMLNLTIISS